MARKKVNLAWIANDSTRRATYKKRRKGLVKKVSELSTLCDVKACMVVYGPQDPLPMVWPSVHEATRVVTQFRSMPEMEQSKKMMNQEGFLRQRVTKLQDQLRKQQRDNREIETTMIMYEGLAGRSLHNIGMQHMTSLSWMLDMKMKMLLQRIEMVRAHIAPHMPPPAEGSTSHALPPPPPMMVDGPMPHMMMDMVRAQMALQRAEASSQALPAAPLVEGQNPIIDMMMTPERAQTSHHPVVEAPMPMMEMMMAPQRVAEVSHQATQAAPMVEMMMAPQRGAEESSQVVQPAPISMIEMMIAQMAPQKAESSQVVQGAVRMPEMKEKTPMEAALEELQRPNWFVDVMNPNANFMFGGGGGGVGGQEMVQSYINHTNPWLDPCYFPFN